MYILSLPFLRAKLSVLGRITCFSSLSEVSTGPVALGKKFSASNVNEKLKNHLFLTFLHGAAFGDKQLQLF